jgi:hypothetical protein
VEGAQGHGADAGEGREHHDEHLAEIAAEGILDEADEVVEDGAAFLDGGDDGGEVVVEQDHLGGLLGDIGAGDAHGHADFRALEGGGVVDAVAGHGDDLAALLQGGDDAQLVFGRDAGIDGDVSGLLFEFGVGEGGEFGAGQDAGSSPGAGGAGCGRWRRR